MVEEQEEEFPGLKEVFAQVPKNLGSTKRVTAALRECIVYTRLGPGAWIREDAIATLLGVSRTPVRDAISILVDEDLVVRLPNRGAQVAPLLMDDLIAAYAVRQQVEGLAARLAAIRTSPQLVAELRDVNQQLQDAIDAHDTDAWHAANMKFHAVLRAHTGNKYLERFGKHLDNVIRRFHGRTSSQLSQPHDGFKEHAAIIEAIDKGNVDQAEELSIAHMRSARATRFALMTGDSPLSCRSSAVGRQAEQGSAEE